MARIRQEFPRPRVENIPGAVAAEMRALLPQIQPGGTVGITVGSRGIRNILTILDGVIAAVRGRGAEPVLLAAMGSHGGGTEDGQKDVLDSLGITEERLGAKIVTCARGREIGVTDKGWRAYMLESAFGVDAILPVNRVKKHTSLTGAIESGLAKMLVVGLGGPPGAEQFHAVGEADVLSPLLVDVSRVILEKMPVIGGLAIVENAYEETARIAAFAPKDMIEREMELLEWSKGLMPALPSARIDGLVVEEMGKNFSGTGVDTNIVGRLRIQGQREPAHPAVRYIAVLDLTDESHGNATGVGLADFVTRRLVDKIDKKATYLNNLTTTFVTRAFIPMCFDTEEETLGTMMHCLRNTPPAELRLVFIPNTLFLTDCYVSEALLPELKAGGRCTVLGEPEAVTFNNKGELALRIGSARV